MSSLLGIEKGRLLCAGFATLLALPLAWAAPGDQKWFFQTAGEIFGSLAMDSKGTVYAGSRDDRVYAVDPNGQMLWSFTAGDWVDSSPTLSHDESVLYFGSWDNNVYAVNTVTGAKVWEFATGSLVIASPSIDASGNLFFGSSDGFFYSLDPNGNLRWQYYVGEEMDSSPTVSEDGSVYVGAFDGLLYAFTNDGNLMWSFATELGLAGEAQRIKSPPTVTADGEIFFGGGDGFLYALDQNGVELWSFFAGDIIDTGVAITPDQSLVFGCRDGSLYSIDKNGILNWESYVGDIFYSTPAVDEFGRIYIGNYLGNGVSGLTCVSGLGTLVWEYLILDYIDSSPLLDASGQLYFGAYDGALYALEVNGGPAETGWSRFGKDAANRSLQDGYDDSSFLSEDYNEWLQVYGLFGSEAEPDADSDGDGIGLLMEYWLSGDPTVAEGSLVNVSYDKVDQGLTTFEFNRNKIESVFELSFEHSTDLMAWSKILIGEPEVTEAILDPDVFGDGKYETVRLTTDTGALEYLRLRAEVF